MSIESSESGDRLLVQNRLLRRTYQLLALLCIALGVTGFILPMFPGTVFLVMAAWLSMRSSPKLNRWLFNHPQFGQILRDWYANRSINPVIGRRILWVLWISFALSIWLAEGTVRIVLAAIGVVLTVYLLHLMRKH